MDANPLSDSGVIDPDQDLPSNEDPEIYEEERRQPTLIDPSISSDEHEEDDDEEEIENNAA